MAGNVENIKGIGLSVVGDASQIKRTFEEAISGLRNKTVQMKLSVVKDSSVDRILREIRQTKVSVDVALHPTRETMRQIRRDFSTAIAKEGGLPVSLKVKELTQQEGARLNASIIRSIGTPVIDIILNPRWGPNGPSAMGQGGGQGGGPGGAGFGQPVRAAQTPRAAPQEPAGAPGARSGVSTRLAGFKRRENESEDEWTNRLIQSRVALLQRIDSKSEKTRNNARRAIVAIDKQLGNEPTVTARPSAVGRADYPERVSATGARVRGGPSVGPLPASGATDYEKVARAFYQNFARRPLSTPLFVGGQFGQTGMDFGAGRFRGPSGRFISGRSFQESRGSGVRGQRTQRSFLEPGLDITEEESAGRRTANVGRVGATRDISPTEDLVKTLKQLPLSFGTAFDEGLDALKRGDLGAALGKHVGPGEAGSGLRGALDQLLTRGRNRQIPGVGPRTVARVLDPKKDILPGPHAEAQAAFGLEVGALQDLIGATHEVQTFQTATAKPKRRRRGQTKAIQGAKAAAVAAGPMSAEEVAALLGGGLGRPEPAPAEAPREAPPAPHVPPFDMGAVRAGGGGGGFGMFGGHGGPVPVEVLNWPATLEGGNVAAQRVMPTSNDFERMFQEAKESVDAANAKLGTTVAAKKGARTPPAKAPQIGTTLRQELQAGLSTKGLTQEDVEQITERGASRSAQDVLGVGGPTTAQGLESLRIRLAESRQGLPIRSPAVTIAQKFAGPQRGAVTARLAEGGRLATQVEAIERENVKLVDVFDAQTKHLSTINELEASGTKLTKAQVREQERLPGAIEKTRGALQRNVTAQGALLTQAQKLAGLTVGEQAANLGRSFAGSIVGTIGYGAALGAVAGAGVLAFKALGPVIERSLGYQNVTAELTNSLTEQQRAQGGNVKALVAQQLATSNMTKANADLVASPVTSRVETQAGARAIQDQTEQLAAGINVQKAMSDVGQDRGGGRARYSANQDLYTSRGGVFDTSLFAPQQSTQEAVARRLDLVRQGLKPPAGGGFALNLAGSGGQIAIPNRPSGGFERNDTALRSFQNDVAAAGLGLKAVEGSAEQVAQTYAALDAADLQEMAKAAQSAGIAFTGLTGDVQRDAIAVTQLTEALGKAASRRNIDQVLQGQGDTIKGVLFGIQRGLTDNLETFLPAARGVRGLAQPQAPFGRGLIPLTNLGDRTPFNLPQTIRGQLNVPGQVSGLNIAGQRQFGGIPQEAIASFSRYREEAQRAIDAVNAKAAEGEQVLRDKLHVPEETITRLRGFGQRIDQISEQQANLQLDLQYSQYNRQLFIARRTLGDIAGLTGKSGATQIGLLQRESLLLGRKTQTLSLQSQLLGLQSGELSQQSAIIGQQSNQLQLQLSQRQINFQRSVAGFTAPGLTPEERAARIEEAKIEADYAQKQLDFQKQQFAIQSQQIDINREQLGYQRESYELAKAQFANQVALQDAMNQRGFEDQLAAIAELQKAFSTGVEIAALEQLEAAISAERDAFVAELDRQIQAEQEFIKAMSQFATDLATQTGSFVVSTVTKVKAMFEQIRAAAPWFFGARGQAPTPQQPPFHLDPGGGKFVGVPHAAGMLGEVSRPTSLGYAGEAGKELVAVIRNPRPIPLGIGAGGGGGGVVQINMPIHITGNSVRDDRDLEEIAARVSRMVETNLGRRASQFGFRVSR